MASEFKPTENASKILAIFAIIFVSFLIFLIGITHVATASQHAYNYVSTVKDIPLRGTIYSRDGRPLSRSFHQYELAVVGRDIKPGMKEEFARLISIYTGLDAQSVLDEVRQSKRVVLLEEMNEALASDLRYLSRRMDALGFFRSVTVSGRTIRRGLDIQKKEERFREYPFDTLLEPVLGHFDRNKNVGNTGLENAYEHILKAGKVGYTRARRDVVGNQILNSEAVRSKHHDGSDIVLSVNSLLQRDVEQLLDEYQTKLEAEELLAIIMDSRNGEIYAIGSTRRYNPEHLSKEEINHMKINAIQHIFEPGSVVKPFVISKMLEEKSVGVYDLVRGYNGRYRLGRKTITDAHAKDWFSVEEVVYYSSNIGMAQLAQELSPYRYNEMMEQFGFAEPSGVDLPYEQVGSLPNISQLKDPLIRATASYGYGFSVNLMQLMKAFNIFNNDGIMIEPRLARKIGMGRTKVVDITNKKRQVLSQVTARKMLGILRKTVTKGTGKRARVEGVFTAGKTGTAHVAKEGKYEDVYHSSFLGFANEEGGDRRFSIGVLAINPKTDYFASKTAVPIFKECVKILIDRGWIRLDPAENGAEKSDS